MTNLYQKALEQFNQWNGKNANVRTDLITLIIAYIDDLNGTNHEEIGYCYHINRWVDELY